ncbi:MAG: phage major tail tube protein [Desulfobacteraceae bacterium]|nr:phage major tail tube protein [Desulfobacteraceae bacterium]
MSNPVPEKIINCRVYLDNEVLIGFADAQLPSLEAMTDTIKGAGIAGEVESPSIGHYKPMTVTLNFRSVTDSFAGLAAQKAHSLDIRGAMQVYDAGAGSYKIESVKVMLKAITKKIDLGKLNAGEAQENSFEGEVVYLKLLIDAKEKIEIDKYNFISKVDGVDQLAEVRSALGINA